MKIADLLIRGLQNPKKAINYLNNKYFKLTEGARVSGGGERVVIKDRVSAKNSRDFVVLAHIQRYEWVKPYLNGLTVLDAGCGSGYGAYYLAEESGCKDKEVVGVDISNAAIKFARRKYKRKNLFYLQMDLCNLGFRDNCFDGAVSFDVLEHLNEHDQEMFITELFRVLNENGRLYIGTPNATVCMGRNPFHLKELTKSEFESLLKKYFENVEILGQDIILNGIRRKENWYKVSINISYKDLTIVEEDCEKSFGLLAVCEKPKKDGW